jgi:hypothetical protein
MRATANNTPEVNRPVITMPPKNHAKILRRSFARTKRPMAWAKKSGVDADVAYTPTARRGTSTPSETMRTATSHRDVEFPNCSMREDASASSDSTTVGVSPVRPSRIAA